ncbi:MAG: hypothetical protein AAB581_03080, partial [Patescibacteria group bacterium]
MRNAFRLTFLLSLTAKICAVAILLSIGAVVSAGIAVGALCAAAVLLVIARRKKRALCDKLASTFPVAVRVRGQDSMHELLAAQTGQGVTVVVRNGERIPVDGVLKSETARLSEYPLAGESKEVIKKSGAMVYAGSLNEGEQITVDAIAAGKDTLIAQRYATARFTDVIRSQSVRMAYGLGTLFTLGAVLVAFVLYFSDWQNSIELAASLLLVISGVEAAYFVAVLVSLAIMRSAVKGMVLKNSGQFDMLAKISLCLLQQSPLTRYRETVIASVRTFWGASTEDVLGIVAAAGLYLDNESLAAATRAAREKNIAHHPPEKMTVTKDQGTVATIGGAAV